MMKSYLNNIQQCVFNSRKYNNVLFPLLFIIYTNNLFHELNVENTISCIPMIYEFHFMKWPFIPQGSGNANVLVILSLERETSIFFVQIKFCLGQRFYS